MSRPDNYELLVKELGDSLDQCLPACQNEVDDTQNLCDTTCPGTDILIPPKTVVIEAGDGVWVQGWIWLGDLERSEP